MNFIFNLLYASAYPILLIIMFYYLYKHNIYGNIIKNNNRNIIINTLVFNSIILLFLFVFFYFEDTIYQYDYAGHWYRYLSVNNGGNISTLKNIIISMNYHEYSLLPAFLQYGFTFISNTYEVFTISIVIYYLIPIVYLLNIIYFKYFNKYKYLPIFICVVFFPLYITIFYGKVGISGLLFILYIIMLVFLVDFNSITIYDNLVINGCGFMMIFLRRWYLYALIGIYITYFIKYLISNNFKIFNKKGLNDFIKILMSGLLLLIILLTIFLPYTKGVLTNNFQEGYIMYQFNHHIDHLIYFISPIIVLISLYGIYIIIKNKGYNTLIYVICLIIIPMIMFIQIQSLDQHHYYIISYVMLFLFTIGLYHLINYKVLFIIISLFMIFQLSIIFIPNKVISPLLVSHRRFPEVNVYKSQFRDLANYIKSHLGTTGKAYVATGDYSFNSELIKNSLLPNKELPNLVDNVYDLRDGFVDNINDIDIIIFTDPILYSLGPEYQYAYDVLFNAITKEDIFKEIYSLELNQYICGYNVLSYKKYGEYKDYHKEYLYNKMIERYPDNKELFSSILD